MNASDILLSMLFNLLLNFANDAIEMLPVATDNTINYLSKYSKEAIYLLRFLLISSLSLISTIK